MALLLGMGALLASLAGYAMLFRRKLRLDVHLIPITLLCMVLCVLYLASLVGLLLPGVYAVCAGGMVMLFWMLASAVKSKALKAELAAFATPGFLGLVLLCGVFYLLCRGMHHTLGDVLGHWGLMTKYLHLYGQLPTAETSIIIYEAYPPGTALVQYFVTSLTGFREGRVIWAQIVFTLAGFCSVFAVLKKKNDWWAALLLWAAVALVFALNFNVYDIIVDTLLPAVAFAGTAGILRYRGDTLRAALVAGPSMAACVLIKNSGLLFAALNMALLLYYALRGKKPAGRHQRLARFLPPALALALPLVCLLLWNLHVDRVFPNGATSDHAMRAENIAQGFQEKTDAEKREISLRFVKRAFSLQENRFSIYLMLWNAVFLAAILYTRRHSKTAALRLLRWILFADAAALLYLAGLLAMYLTTMTTGEALGLASFDRYFASMVIYLTMLLLWVLPEENAWAKGTPPRRVLLALAAVPIAFGLWRNANTLRLNLEKPPYEDTIYATLDEQIAILNQPPPIDLCLVLAPEEIDARTSASALLRYKLFSSAVSLVYDIEDDRALFDQLASSYRYLLVLEDSPNTTALLDEYPRYGRPESYVGVYNLPLW